MGFCAGFAAFFSSRRPILSQVAPKTNRIAWNCLRYFAVQERHKMAKPERHKEVIQNFVLCDGHRPKATLLNLTYGMACK